MKTVTFREDWPDSWKHSYEHDLNEIYGRVTHRGYAYAYWNRYRQTIDAVRRCAPEGGTVLDVAAAQGNFSLGLAELGYSVTWNDLREDLAGYVSLKHESGRLEYAPGNVFEIGLPAKFDVVVITEIIEHVAHPDEFLNKISTLVKPGGHIIMTTPSGRYFRNSLPKFSECPDPEQFESVQFKPDADGHIFLLHDDEIEPLARKAGRVKEIRLFNNPLTNGYIKTGLLLRILPKAIVDAIESATAARNGAAFPTVNVHMLVDFQRP